MSLEPNNIQSLVEEPTTSQSAALTEPSTSSQASRKAASEPQAEKTFSRYRSLILTECSFKISTTENYIKRLQNLRNENLNYINETDWMFETTSLDKKPF